MGRRAVHLGWLVLVVGPPAIAWAAMEHQVAAHRFAAVFIALAYEAIVLVAGFITGVAGDLLARWRVRLVERLDRWFSRVFSRFGGQYRSLVLEDLRYIDQKGLGTVGPFTPRLDEVFVDVSLALQAPHQISGGLLSNIPADRPERRALGDFLDHEKPVVLAVIGAPGSGKTTLLRNTARLACTTGRRRKVPVLLYLRDHVAAIAGNRPPGLAEAVRGVLGDGAVREPAGWFEQRLLVGDCVVLLDGLDEVAGGDDRRKIAAWVETQIQRYPRNDYVITARPLGYLAAPVSGAVVLQVLGFTFEQVNRFVRGWYLAAERFNAGEDSQHVRQQAADGAADLLERLDRASALYDLTTNPLLLTMIANVHLYRGQLPGSRAELYREICQVMLWQRQEAKRLPAGPGPAREAVLRALAYDMMNERKRDVTRPKVLERFENALQRVASRQTAEEFLADVSSSGLLVEREPGLYCFAHQTFQEYLAAAHIHDKSLVYVLVAEVNDDWWRETTLLYVADADADLIVKACLTSGGVTALALVFGCAQEARELSLELRQQLDHLLAEASAPGTDPERRRLLTGVLLIRHLDQQVTTQSGGRVCPLPISQSLYWLFLEDTGSHPPDGPPPDKTSDAPAVGMRADDAEAFVRWQNSLIGSETAYRLPTHTEISDRSAHRLLLPAGSRASGRSAWITSGSGATELWIPPAVRDPRELDRQALADYVHKDIAQSSRDLTKLLLLRAEVVASLLARELEKPSAAVLARDLVSTLVRARSVSANPARPSGLDQHVDRARALVRLTARIESGRGEAARQALSEAQAFGAAIAAELPAGRVLWSLVIPSNRELSVGFSVTGENLMLNFEQVVGQALSQSLSQAVSAVGEAAFKAAFSKAFCLVTGVTARPAITKPQMAPAWPPLIVFLGELGTRLDGAVDAVLRGAGAAAPSAWGREAAHRVQQMAGLILQRTESPDPAITSACRLTVLCLAAETAATDPRTTKAFSDVAAGLTLLQQRQSGDAPATETILLARA